MSKVLNKWIGAYDGAKRLQISGWSEADVLAKAQELYARGSIGSGSSGSKRSHDSDACGSNSIGSSVPPIGREAAKKKGKKKSKDATLEEVEKEWVEFKEIKVQEIEQFKEFTLVQQEKNRLKKMKLYVKLSFEEHLDDRKIAVGRVGA
ncbi:hypothetical protein MTR_2g014785 [Medicago truncatula]|uniref:Homeodomain-like, putative n=1 Tax=Medicago truncatula TaxID=3880 RepID=A2Q534_MEDTR|nr:Homeodomain-like, putative [Medicago truncatula]KEH36567.1 hypothetical protein MTR_2g014785 [Medicago truncatula]